MSYDSLVNIRNVTNNGLTLGTDYGSGIQWALGLSKLENQPILQIGLYIVDSYENITVGDFDNEIGYMASFLMQLNSSIFLRIGYEFNSLENNYNPTVYVLAYQYIVNRINSYNPHNIAYVWHASGFVSAYGASLISWFPGKNYVDWCGVSLFQQPFNCSITNTSNGNNLTYSSQACSQSFAHVEELVAVCDGLGIPVMIAESTPIGGIVDEGYFVLNIIIMIFTAIFEILYLYVYVDQLTNRSRTQTEYGRIPRTHLGDVVYSST